MIDLDELERALVPMDKTLSVRQERYGMARVGVEHAPGAVEVVGEFVLLKHAKEYAALRNAAPELLAIARRYQWGVKHARWLRHEHEAYVAIPVALDADLSCEATRHAAIDAAMQEKP